MLTNLDCQIFINGSTIQEVGRPFTSLFFNFRNGVRIQNPWLGIAISDLPEESFFGDYQILLSTVSMYDYKATSDTIVRNKTDGENTWCMTIDAKKFI